MFLETLLRMSDEIFFFLSYNLHEWILYDLKTVFLEMCSEIWNAESSLLLNMITEVGEIFLEQLSSCQQAFSSSVIISGPW